MNAFTSWDIEPYVYSNCLFPRLRRHTFLYQSYLSSRLILSYLSSRFSAWPKKSRQKFKYLQKKKSFLTIFKGISVAENYIRHKSALLSQSFDCWNFFLFWNTAGRNEHFSNRRQYTIWQMCLFTKKLTNLFSSTMLRYFAIVPYQFVR